MSTKTPKPFLERVVLRGLEPEDYAAMREIFAQPKAFADTMHMPFPSKQMWQQRLAQISPSRHSLVACVDDLPIGNIGLIVSERPRQRHMGSVGMGVHDDYAGRGVGELLMRAALDLADNWLNLSRVELTVFADNERAIRLYERTGFETEGRLKRYAFREGELVDALVMARLT
jgi:putative acetyltransferase